MKFGRGRVHSVQSRAQHDFAKVPVISIPRSVFNRSHGYKTTFQEGYLIPILVDEVLPGDTFNVDVNAFARTATLIEPIMDNMFLDVHCFFVPNRLVWENWEAFNGEQTNPDSSTDFIVPQLVAGGAGFASLSVADYFGIPTLVPNLSVNAMPFRGLNLIYNDWYRDQNLQDSLVVQMDDGPDDLANYPLLQRGKRHDYFTSCLPWPQKVNDGSTLNVPLSGTAPVVSTGVPFTVNSSTLVNQNLGVGPGTSLVTAAAVGNGALDMAFAGVTGLEANLADASGVTINELREAFQVQRMFEKDARGGTRYIEIIKNHFGVDSPDMRLQRPEYLGGGSSAVNVHPVPQTSVTAATPQANLAAFGTMSLSNCGFVKSFTEHGYIFIIASVRADLNYQQGLNRMWSRSTRYDFFWPSLAHIGEQAVLNKEIYAQGNDEDTEVFGYQERYGEMRYFPGQITGEFRSNYATPLDSWHLAQNFGALPVLNAAFIVESAPMARIIAVEDAAHFLFDSYISMKCARPMPVYGVPGLIDHF